MLKKRKDYIDSMLDETHDLAKVLEQESGSYAKSRYAEIVSSTLLLILDSLRVLRTFLCALLGFLIGLLLSSLF